MARVKRAVNAHKKRRSTLEAASGYRGQRSRLYRKAKEQLLHSATYQYRDRKARKGDFRQLWIQRINAAARMNGMTYNRFIQGLRLAGLEVDRKMLAELAVSDEATFTALVAVAKEAVAAEGIGGPVAQYRTAVRHCRPDRPTPVRPIAQEHRRCFPTPTPGSPPPADSPVARAAARPGVSWLRVRRRCARPWPTEPWSRCSPPPRPERHGDCHRDQTAGSVTEISARAAAELSETVHPQGLVAVCRTIDATLDDVVRPRAGPGGRAGRGQRPGQRRHHPAHRRRGRRRRRRVHRRRRGPLQRQGGPGQRRQPVPPRCRHRGRHRSPLVDDARGRRAEGAGHHRRR